MRGKPVSQGRGRKKTVRFQKLRTLMAMHEMTATELGRIIGVEGSAVSRRLAGKTPWTVWEAYAVLKAMGVPPEEIYYYFPVDDKETERISHKYVREYLKETDQSLVPNVALRTLVTVVQGLSGAPGPGDGAQDIS